MPEAWQEHQKKWGQSPRKLTIKKRKFPTYCLGRNVTLTESPKVFFLRSLIGGSVVQNTILFKINLQLIKNKVFL
ncbi:hypothetical protein [Anabaena sp. PCC 7108]|uniref:hypothetical protein n=1 Tax=Anabaena sp. PCC 7108 TaxID=163908 RepID=UPI00034A377A|nr:hypothetical protein [Anabaena sp. PCC 7108]